jgi:hypothetical protein
MQQNKIEVAFVCGGHNIGPANNEDGCCCLHLQNNGKRHQDVNNTFHCAARLCGSGGSQPLHASTAQTTP